MEARITPDHISKLGLNQIFVFESNLPGMHSVGTALQALSFGAAMGRGIGLQGYTYAIPIKDYDAKNVLPLNTIQRYIDEFIQCAVENPQLTFLVTRIGCGFAGYTLKQIASLFRDAVRYPNIHLPEDFWEVIN